MPGPPSEHNPAVRQPLPRAYPSDGHDQPSLEDPLTLAHGAEQSPTMRPVEVAARWIRALNEHDLDAAVGCFHPQYRDQAPARRGEAVEGREQVRAIEASLFRDVADLRAELVSAVEDRNTVWMEWRMWGTRPDGTPMEFVGVNIFEVDEDRFRSGRIYTELVRDAGGVAQQVERMTQGTALGGETLADSSA
jgi:limonene-1,2-epoxide hydrolase